MGLADRTFGVDLLPEENVHTRNRQCGRGTLAVTVIAALLSGCDASVGIGPDRPSGPGSWNIPITPDVNPVPRAVAGNHAFTRIDAGWNHTCAVDTAGAAWCWGSGGVGQLGGTGQSSAPVSAAPGHRFEAIDVAFALSCGLSNARLLCWGSSGEIPVHTAVEPVEPWSGSAFADLSLGGANFTSSQGRGGAHLCAVDTAGGLRCAGANYFGQLGNGVATPKDSALAPVAGLHGAVQVSAGWTHSCALLDTGEAWCWGEDADGALGDGMGDLPTCDWAGITAPCATTPVRVNTEPRFRTLSAGTGRTCAIDDAGRLFCWGRIPSDHRSFHPRPVEVDPTPFGGQPVVAVVLGFDHTCALLEDGRAFCWGDNTHGQLGTGDSEHRTSPSRVSGGLRFRAITAGNAYTCAIAMDDRGYCWGAGEGGRLGYGD